MLLLGHLGIGAKLVAPLTRGLPLKGVFFGTILPDLIDKPLYYGLSFLTGQTGHQVGLISGTRTFGHTALFLLSLTMIAIAKKSKLLAAIALGVASHLILDGVTDALHHTSSSSLLWPLIPQFPEIPFRNIEEHLAFWNRPVLVWGEIIGFLLLITNQSSKNPKRPYEKMGRILKKGR